MHRETAIVVAIGVIGGVAALSVLEHRAPRSLPEPSASATASALHPIDALRQSLAALSSASSPAGEPARLTNRAAYLPAQCYASTVDPSGATTAGARTRRRTHNGCFACHQTSRAPNFVDDADVQTTLSVPAYAEDNHWTNLRTRPPPVDITDAALVAHVRASNYFGEAGELRLAERLSRVPREWDGNGDGRWNGYVPDCWFAFDDSGFDRAPGGRMTGWRAFAYVPFPGMFWPTNGSAGDVLIRLPAPFRQDRDGNENEAVYRINLAIVEAYVRRNDVPIAPADERELGSDLDGDGVLGTATRVAFVWPAREGRRLGWVGAAAALDPNEAGRPVAGLYPTGTELLHSLRYLDVTEARAVRMAARMKELRYMRKTRWLTYSDLQLAAEAEAREKVKSPNRLKVVVADVERGVGTGTGWMMQAFIEDASGELRPETAEETTACVGCHGGIGVTTDSTFAFARKLDARSAHRAGWYHWSQRDLTGIPEPKRADGKGEYAHWLEQVGGGDDFRTNDEVAARFFRSDGTLDPNARRALSKDIATLLVPSPERAIALDRAYLALVRAQRFEAGRDVVVGGPPKVQERLEQDGATGIEEPVTPGWLRPKKTALR
ncbi:MAG: hypothetical protein KF795_28385 [Labilithrix sp.]|nr:hypothetical protein [Labilithrix sp.]